MLKIVLTVSLIFIFSFTFGQIGIIAKDPSVVTGKLIRTTKALRDFKLADKAIPDVKVRDEDGIIGKDEAFEEGEEREFFPPSRLFNEDPALQKIYPNNPHLQKQLSRAVNTNFNGMPYQPLNPPDPTLCVGPNHVIQMINGSSGALFKVYNKSGGQVVAQTYLDAITGKGGLGDPIALYDQFADRFILTEFAHKSETGTEGLIFAISQTADPAGSWYVYFFSTGNTFPDYPKFSVWTDAYYGTTNDFANGSTYSGSSVYAFDKAKMLAGNPTATVQKFTPGNTNKFFSMCPVSIEGTSVPPAGTGGLIAYMLDDAWTLAADVDSIGLLEFKVDFTIPANSRLSTKASLATLPFKSDICSATRGQCISQPVSITKVEALHQKIMNKPIYRKFGSYEGIVFTHVVDKGSNISGVRWYELRKTTGNWGIYQQSTYAPDNTHRWMPGICYDKNGNIALAYNVSASAGIYPGARYTGRKECDSLNKMTYSEDVIINGTASNTSTRYGDYNELVCDPDGLTFWFTCEYNAATTWSTRISSFTLDPCSTPVCGDPTSLTTTAITNTSATIGWTAGSNNLTYDVDYKLNSSGTWLNLATATNSTSVNLTGLTQGSTYDWRVRATCASGTGNYVASQFITTLPVVCDPPTGLTSSSISNTSEGVLWTAVAGATSYDVEYKLNTDPGYTSAASGITSVNTTITGLTPGTLYDWRVKATCSGTIGNYTAAQFTTSSAPVCNTPTGLTTTSITTNSASVGWTADPNALNYDVDYKASTSGTWIPVASGTTTIPVPVSGLNPSTSYDWRVRSHCSGATSGYAQSQFTTGAIVVTCPADQLEPNNSFQTAASISTNTDYNATITISSDLDYYSFSTSGAQKNVRVTLTNLPVNFDLQLLDANGAVLSTSQNTGSTSESVTYNNKKPAGYKVKVYSTGGAVSSQCYTLRVTTGSATFSPSSVDENIVTRIFRGGLKVFPIPASTSVTISFDSYHKGLSEIIVSNQLGQEVFNKKMNVIEGNNSTIMNVNTFKPGVYFIKVYNGKTVETQKMIISNK